MQERGTREPDNRRRDRWYTAHVLLLLLVFASCGIGLVLGAPVTFLVPGPALCGSGIAAIVARRSLVRPRGSVSTYPMFDTAAHRARWEESNAQAMAPILIVAGLVASAASAYAFLSR
jgi:hypothetical protein